MRRIILDMIASGSLSAFSTTALSGLPSQASGVSGTAGVRQVRTGQVPPPVQSPAQQQSLDQGKAAASPSGRVPQRGSLLDLSV